MKRYIFFTKSYWPEPPRLRHQVANLLRSNGGDILFFERPSQLGERNINSLITEVEPRLRIVRTRELIHHQLRVVSLLRAVNAFFEKSIIRKVLLGEKIDDVTIVNFNYDYYFLRDLFPKNKIITIINDDFVAQAKLFNGVHVLQTLGKTCSMSDAVLVVSYPLAEQVQSWCTPNLFFPWSDVEYRAPTREAIREHVLIWAHINDSMDFELLKETSRRRPNLIFHIVGPVRKNALPGVNLLKNYSDSFVFRDSTSLNELPLETYFCSIIPYLKGIKFIEAVTMSNKTLQLLARGIPILTHGMPNFYKHQSIVNTNSIDEFVEALDFFKRNFYSLQGVIDSLVSENQANQRFEQLKEIIES